MHKQMLKSHKMTSKINSTIIPYQFTTYRYKVA
nr:MAG TPA: hypothetical protein [Caudoviricetes sp.]